jgi:hypothetical protein
MRLTMKKLVYFVFVAVFVDLLAGCSTTTISKDFSINSESKEGVIVFSVSHDHVGKRGAKGIFHLDGGAMNGGDTFISLHPVMPGVPFRNEFNDSYGRILAVSLPAGKHEFSSWQITNGAGLRISPKETPTPLVFEVVSGQIKYLGNLHANLSAGNNIFGMKIVLEGYPEILDRRARDISIFENKYPQLKGKVVFDLLPLGPWMQSSGTRKSVDFITPLPLKVSK